MTPNTHDIKLEECRHGLFAELAATGPDAMAFIVGSNGIGLVGIRIPSVVEVKLELLGPLFRITPASMLRRSEFSFVCFFVRISNGSVQNFHACVRLF